MVRTVSLFRRRSVGLAYVQMSSSTSLSARISFRHSLLPPSKGIPFHRGDVAPVAPPFSLLPLNFHPVPINAQPPTPLLLATPITHARTA